MVSIFYNTCFRYYGAFSSCGSGLGAIVKLICELKWEFRLVFHKHQSPLYGEVLWETEGSLKNSF